MCERSDFKFYVSKEIFHTNHCELFLFLFLQYENYVQLQEKR